MHHQQVGLTASIQLVSAKRSRFEIVFHWVKLRDELFISKFWLNYLGVHQESKQHAFEIWSALSGQWHDVYSGICVASSSKILSTVVRTQVEFQRLSDAEMEKYWATGEPIGKAGAYAIQGIAAQYIPQIRGSYSNVVGLPLYETVQLLESIKASV